MPPADGGRSKLVCEKETSRVNILAKNAYLFPPPQGILGSNEKSSGKGAKRGIVLKIEVVK